MPLVTTGYNVWVKDVVDPESEVETYEETLCDVEEDSYKGLTESEEAMVDARIQASLADTPFGDSSCSSTVDVTPRTEAQDQSDASGIDSPTDGVTF